MRRQIQGETLETQMALVVVMFTELRRSDINTAWSSADINSSTLSCHEDILSFGPRVRFRLLADMEKARLLELVVDKI